MFRSYPGRKILVLVLCLFLSGAWTTSALAGGVFRFPLFYVPSSLDPVKDDLVSMYHVVQQVYDGLVAFDSNLRVVPVSYTHLTLPTILLV